MAQNLSPPPQKCAIYGTITSSEMARERDRQRGNTDWGCGGVNREETCKVAEGLVPDWGTRREGNGKAWASGWGMGQQSRRVKGELALDILSYLEPPAGGQV